MRRQLSPRRAHRGFALLALFAFLMAGVLYFVVTSLGPDFFEAYRARKTEQALAEARDALTGYALYYRDRRIVDGTPDGLYAMYGFLPMPDLGESQNRNGDLAHSPCATEGCAKLNVNGTGATDTYIGRFPWRTLGTEPIRDGYGECLWYIVSASHKALNNSGTLNWDAIGNMDIVIADGADSLKSVIASAHDKPIVIVFSPGPALSAQDRSPSAVDDVTECGGNYVPANYLDPNVSAALLDSAGNPTASSTYYSGLRSTDTSAVSLAISTQGAIHKAKDDKLWANTCQTGSNCTLVANDVGLAITPDTLFGALRKNANFRIDVSSLLDRIVGCLRDTKAAGGSLQADGKISGDDDDSCYGKSVVPRGYYPNYKDMIFVASPAGLFSVKSDMAVQPSCVGALIFANQRAPGKSRISAADKAHPFANYLEDENLAYFTSGVASFAGAGLFNRVTASKSNASDVARCTVAANWQVSSDCHTAEQDIVRCIPDTASLVATYPMDYTGPRLVNYVPGTRTLTLGAPNVVAEDASDPIAPSLFGCAWTPEANTQGKGFRAYFTFRFNKLGSGVGNTGYTFAAIDAESNVNISLPCGASGSHLGYSGNNGITPRIASPKIGIEFDQSRNTGFSEGSGNPGRADPCGASSCGGSAGFNSHAAIVYWGHETTNATDGVALPNDDDNVHGFPTSGSESSNLAPPPHNPSNLVATPPGIAFVDMRSKSGEGGNSYLYHVRVEVTPLTAATSLGDARAAAVSNVALASPGTVLGGVTLSDGDRVLLAAQTALAENGVYAWHGPANPLTRPSDADSGGELTKAAIRISEGISGGSTWRQTRTIGTVDVDVQSWQLYVQDVKTEVWIDHSSGTPMIAAMEDTTRPMAQLVPTAIPTLRDTATIYGVAGATCSPGCPTDQTCGTGNKCYRQPMKSIRLGFTGSQWTQDQQVVITDFFSSWLQ